MLSGLSGACRRFRAHFSPGSAHPHRRDCRECEAFAAALESAAGARLPLPSALRQTLRAIAGPEEDAVLPFAVPRLPVPDALARRLRGIARPGQTIPLIRQAPPEWVRSPRYAVAASALLALLLGPFLAGAVDHGRQALGAADAAVDARMSPLLRRTGDRGQEEIGRLRSTTAAVCDAARQSFESSLGRLDDGLSGLSVRLSNVLSENLDNLGPRSAAGSVRRPQ
ncbi:MAG TPA: hypothetical protein VGH73_07350 [Thermoanaerobaculia bacterium]|jgi:hypothetical protein